MKNRILQVLIALFVFLAIPFDVDAATFSLSASCGSSVTVGQTVTCKINGTVSGTSVAGFQANYSVSGGTLKSFTTASGWQGEGDGGRIDLYTDTNKTGTFSIGTITITANKVGNITLSITNIGAADENFVDIGNIPNVTRTINVKNTTTTTKKTTTTTRKTNTTTRKPTTTKNVSVTNTTLTTSTTVSTVDLRLTSVSVDNYEVTYEDGKYYTTVDSLDNEVDISATAAYGITIIGVGTRTLTTGKNVVDLILRSQSGQTTTVQVIITKPDGTGVANTSLTQLKVVNNEVDFETGKTEFTVSIPFNTKEIYVIAKGINDDVIITGDGLHTISKNKQEIIIRVSYGDIESTEYKLIVKKNYNLVFLWIGLAGLGAGIVFIYFRVKSNKNKQQAAENAAINKEKAIINRKEASQGQSMTLNGEKNAGVGRRMVEPTPVMATSTEESALDKQPNVVKQVVKPTTVQTTQQNPVTKQVVVKKAPVQVVSSAPDAQVKVDNNVLTQSTGSYDEEDVVIKDI